MRGRPPKAGYAANPAQYVHRRKVQPAEAHGLDRAELGTFLFTAECFDRDHAALAVRREQRRPQWRAAPSEDPARPEVVMTSKAQREGITRLRAAPACAMRCTGRMAPENNTAGKHSIGRASVA